MGNLLNMLDELIPEDLVPSIAKVSYENESSIIKALQYSIPAIFDGILSSNSESNTKLNKLLTLAAKKENYSEDLLQGILNGKNTDSLNIGSQMLDIVFDKRFSSISSIVATKTGLRSNSSSSILNVSAAIIASFLGQKMKNDDFNINNLLQWLKGYKQEVKESLPLEFAQLKASREDSEFSYDQDDNDDNSTKKWMLPLILFGLLGIGIWYWMQGCNKENAINSTISGEVVDSASMSIKDAADIAASKVENNTDNNIDTTLGKIDESGNWIAQKGDSIKLKLDNGVEIFTFKNSLEDKLYSYIKDPTATVGKDVWFNFNDLLFNTGKYTLKPNSSKELENMVEILKAYPKLKIKLGGYTDNVGDSTANVKLSENRAKTVYNMLLNKGVDNTSFDSKPYEGYGSMHPVAENNTVIGRAQNRRISISVREK